MSRRRTRDLGFHHVNIELMIVVAIIGILAAISIPHLVKIMDKRAVTCLGNVLLQAEGKLGKEATCPVSRKGYAPPRSGETEAFGCPAPEGHLDSKPRLVRSKEGPWRFEQTLPAYSGRTVELKGARVEIKTHPGRTAVHVLPIKAVRYVFGPLMFLIFAIVSLGCLARFLCMLWTRKWDEATGPAVWMLITGGITYLAMTAFASSHEWVLERSGARVTRVEYLFGRRTSEKAIDGCLAIVPTKASGDHRLHLVHPPQSDGARTTPIGLIEEDRLDVADWFHRALVGP